MTEWTSSASWSRVPQLRKATAITFHRARLVLANIAPLKWEVHRIHPTLVEVVPRHRVPLNGLRKVMKVRGRKGVDGVPRHLVLMLEPGRGPLRIAVPPAGKFRDLHRSLLTIVARNKPNEERGKRNKKNPLETPDSRIYTKRNNHPETAL